MESYVPGQPLVSPFASPALPAPDASVGISAELLSKVEAEASARGLESAALLEMIVRDAIEG